MSRMVCSFLICLTLLLSGCAAVTISQDGTSDFKYQPDFEEAQHFFLWGLIGDKHINVKEICGSKPAVQMQSKFTAMNVLYTGLTLGLYLPRTARVWCKRDNEI